MFKFGKLENKAKASVISGELQAGGNSICLMFMFDFGWSAPRRPPWAACLLFRDLYSIDATSHT